MSFSLPLISSGRAFAVRTACTFSGVPERKGMVEREEKGGEVKEREGERERERERRGKDRGEGEVVEASITSHYWQSINTLFASLAISVTLSKKIISCLLQNMSALF